MSYSQLQTWDRCKFSWDLGYRQGWSSKSSKRYFEFGGLAHDFLALYFEHKRDRKSDAEFQVAYKNMIRAKYDANAENPETLAEVVQLIDRYISDYSPFNDQHMIVRDVEYHFEIPLTTPVGRTYWLQGYIDLIVEIEGKLWIGEHKTIGNAKGWSPVEILMDAQTPTYAAALKEIGHDTFGIMYTFLNSYNYKDMKNTPPDKLFKRDFSYRNDRELKSILFQAGSIVDEICDYLEAPPSLYSDGPRKSMKKDCSFCQFQEPCLMDTKGLNMEAHLQINYKKKEARDNNGDGTQTNQEIILSF